MKPPNNSQVVVFFVFFYFFLFFKKYFLERLADVINYYKKGHFVPAVWLFLFGGFTALPQIISLNHKGLIISLPL